MSKIAKEKKSTYYLEYIKKKKEIIANTKYSDALAHPLPIAHQTLFHTLSFDTKENMCIGQVMGAENV